MSKSKSQNSFVSILQKQIESDIQGVKTGALDDTLLRARMTDNIDPDGPFTRLNLWLCALNANLIDDLSVRVSDSDGNATFEFFPIWNNKEDVKAPVLQLPVPGPKKVVTPELLESGTDEHALEAQHE